MFEEVLKYVTGGSLSGAWLKGAPSFRESYVRVSSGGHVPASSWKR